MTAGTEGGTRADKDWRTRVEMAELVAERTGIDRDDILEVIDGWLAAVGDTLAEDRKVVIRGFGTFEPTRTEEHRRPVPGQGEVVVPPKRRIRFTASGVLRERVERGTDV